MSLEGVFLSVKIERSAMGSSAAPAQMKDVAVDPGPTVLAQRVEIALSDGHRILMEGSASLASVVGYLVYLREKISAHLDAGGGLAAAYYVDQSPYAGFDTFEELATKNTGRVFEQMERVKGRVVVDVIG